MRNMGWKGEGGREGGERRGSKGKGSEMEGQGIEEGRDLVNGMGRRVGDR